MKYKGITYDVGTEYVPGNFTRDNLTADILRSDMQVIKNELNCNAIRIYGKAIDKLILAADIALQNGLAVWLSPRLINGSMLKTLSYLKDTAKEFKQLKIKFPEQELVFIIGGELTIDTSGFVKGDNIHERIKTLMKPIFFIKNALGIKPPFQREFSKFLSDAAHIVRREFDGKVTYASAMWENVDWAVFDIVAINLYRASFNDRYFEKTLKKLLAKGKPVAITEFGCCCFEGADKKGPAGYFVLDSTKTPPAFKEKCIRNEQVQADYIVNLLKLYDDNNVYATFVFDFYTQKVFHNADPEFDYDMANFGITKSIGGKSWEPKKSFFVVADFYKNL